MARPGIQDRLGAQPAEGSCLCKQARPPADMRPDGPALFFRAALFSPEQVHWQQEKSNEQPVPPPELKSRCDNNHDLRQVPLGQVP